MTPNTEQFEFLHPLCRVFRSVGFEIYLVGGCVRDFIRGDKVKDFDLTTNARPESIKTILQMLGANVVEKNGGNFGTVHCIWEGQDVEITTYRLDKKYETGSRRPEVEFADKLEDDLIRRDFTINAMTMDEFGNINFDSPMAQRGYKDLKNGILTAPRDPEIMFEEDPLRILRMYRFAHRFRFQVCYATRAAAHKFADHLVHISRERVQEEFTKICNGRDAHVAIPEMINYGVMKHVIPDFANMPDSELEHAMKMVFDIQFWGSDYRVVLAAMFYSGYGDPKKDLKNLKFSNDDLKAVETLTRMARWAADRSSANWDEAMIRTFVNMCKGFHMGVDTLIQADFRHRNKRWLNFPNYVKVKEFMNNMDEETIAFLVDPRPAMDGNEIKEFLDIQDGPFLGRLMKELTTMAVEGRINTKERAMEWLRHIPTK